MVSNPGIIILAAGLSRRYLQATGRHKLLEEITGTGMTLFQHSLANALKTGLPVTVVLRPDALALQADCLCAKVPFVCVESQSMGESIVAGVEASPNPQGWIVTLADLPSILPKTYAAIIQAVREGECARPSYCGQPGHPVGFPATLRDALLALQGCEGARELLKVTALRTIDCADQGCVRDIDHPKDFGE